MKTNAAVKLKGFILMSLIKISYSANPLFRADAEDFVTMKLKDSKIFLEWEPLKMVEDIRSIDRNEFVVQIRSEDGEYKLVTESPKVRGDKFMHTISIVPSQGVQQQLRRKICCEKQRW
eukprot:GFUD01046292.1.p2 GENE.GFUD01046292.1~~GFUD01046292.1.p2  ORF type:complete len:119 (+),score=19.85 GFUD01046292.1:120-476(+)